MIKFNNNINNFQIKLKNIVGFMIDEGLFVTDLDNSAIIKFSETKALPEVYYVDETEKTIRDFLEKIYGDIELLTISKIFYDTQEIKIIVNLQ